MKSGLLRLIEPDRQDLETSRVKILVKDMLLSSGMAPSADVYRLIEPHRSDLALDDEFFTTDQRLRLIHRLSQLEPEGAGMERLIGRVYERIFGYEVELLDGAFPAFDLIARKVDASGLAITVAIQVKHRTQATKKADIFDEVTLGSAKSSLHSRGYQLTHVMWYASKGMEPEARELLAKRISNEFGHSCLTTTND